jgi:ornithine cyclodeaminase
MSSNCAGTSILIFGAGMQAEQHLHAFSKALGDRPLPRVVIINRTKPRAERLREHAIEQGWVEACGCQVVLSSDRDRILECFRSRHDPPDDGIRFKILATCTNSIDPLWDGEMAQMLAEENERVLICSVGSYTPSMREVPPEMIRRCTGGVWVDTMDAKPVGDLSPLFDDDKCKDISIQLIGKILKDFDDNHENSMGGCVFYKSVGTAIQDVLTAGLIVKRARELNLGIEVDMS